LIFVYTQYTMSDSINPKHYQCPIDLLPEDSRYTTRPITRKSLWKYYLDHRKSYWVPEEITLAKDLDHFENRLTNGERHFVKHVLAFFAASDGIVNLNLAARFRQEIPILEAQYFYDFQIMIENIHAEMYSKLLDELILDPVERSRLLDAQHTIPVVQKMTQWMFDCVDSRESFASRLLRMACVEGLFFTGCFCAIYWLQSRGLMPGLAHSNDLIAKDEAFHTMFALFLYTMIRPADQLSADAIHDIIRAAVVIAKEFIAASLPINLPEMNADLMGAYIECQADNLAILLGVPPIYKAVSGFHFMEQINMQQRVNFFERRVAEYGQACQSDKIEFERSGDF